MRSVKLTEHCRHHHHCRHRPLLLSLSFIVTVGIIVVCHRHHDPHCHRHYDSCPSFHHHHYFHHYLDRHIFIITTVITAIITVTIILAVTTASESH